jgi:homoserine dehydrogenase
MSTPEVRLGVIGFGTVGRSYIHALQRRRESLEHLAGVRLTIAELAVRDPRPQPLLGGPTRVHTDAAALAQNPAIDIVVEVSGADAAPAWITAALDRGAAVVSANKRALASSRPLLQHLAARRPGLYCEASVAAAVPIVRALSDSLQGDEILGIRGILNGTTTYVLSAIENGYSFLGALAYARSDGICEGDAQLDLGGADAAHKLAILCALAWGRPIAVDSIPIAGISIGTEMDARRALARNCRLRVVASARLDGEAALLRVAPELLDWDDPLAQATGVTNIVEIDSALAGILRWSGPGAGGRATASALLADTLAAARWLAPALTRRVAA